MFVSLRSVAVGISLWETYTASRELVIRSGEQRIFYSWNQAKFLSILNNNVLPNVLSPCSGLVGRVSSWFLLHSHVFSFLIFNVFLIFRDQFFRIKSKLERLEQIVQGVDLGNAPGECIVNKTDGKFIDGSPLKHHFPKSSAEDNRSVAERINDANSWVRSFRTEALYSVGNFLLMHLGDMVVFITLACKGLYIFYWRQDLIENTIQAFFCLLCLGTQEQFWMYPTYNRGFLCTIFGSGAFNWIRKCIMELRVISYIVEYIGYGPLFGTIIIIMDLVPYLALRLFHGRTNSFIKTLVMKIGSLFLPAGLLTKQPDSSSNPEDHNFLQQPLSVVGGRFNVLENAFICCYNPNDPQPQKSLEELEIELLLLVENVTPPHRGWLHEEHGYKIWGEHKTNREALRWLLNGELISRNMDTDTLKTHAKVILSTLISEFNKGGDKLLRSFVDIIPDFDSCPKAVKRVVYDFFLQVLASIYGVEVMRNNSAIASFIGELPKVSQNSIDVNAEDCNRDIDCFAIKLLYINQSMRDRECRNVIARVISVQEARLRRLKEDFAEGAHGTINSLYDICELIPTLLPPSLIGRLTKSVMEGGGVFGRIARGYVRSIFLIVFRFLLEQFLEANLSFASNEHYVNIMQVAIAKRLGLREIHSSELLDSSDSIFYSFFESIYSDIDSLTTKVMAPTFLDFMFGKMAKKACVKQLLPELQEVLLCNCDERMTYQQLFCARRALTIASEDLEDASKELELKKIEEDFIQAGKLYDEFFNGTNTDVSMSMREFQEKVLEVINPHLYYVLCNLHILKDTCSTQEA